MLKTVCKELAKTAIESALCTVVTFGTFAIIGVVKNRIDNSKEDKKEEN